MVNFWDGGGSVHKINKFDMFEVGLCPFIHLAAKVANRKVENCDHHFCLKNLYAAGTDYSHQPHLPDCDDCCASSVSQSETESVTVHCGN
jgi:hypothetical protein